MTAGYPPGPMTAGIDMGVSLVAAGLVIGVSLVATGKGVGPSRLPVTFQSAGEGLAANAVAGSAAKAAVATPPRRQVAITRVKVRIPRVCRRSPAGARPWRRTMGHHRPTVRAVGFGPLRVQATAAPTPALSAQPHDRWGRKSPCSRYGKGQGRVSRASSLPTSVASRMLRKVRSALES